MKTVTVSSKYQIVIPREIREQLDIQVGQKIQLIPYRGRIEFVPLRNMKSMKGYLRGMDTDVLREKDRL